MDRRFFCVLVGSSVLCLAGCRNNYEMPPPSPVPPAVTNTHLKIALQMSPLPVRQMDLTTFTVHLNGAQGEPVTGAAVRADLVMPAMDMGKNTVSLRPGAKGTYSGIGRFPMDGSWRLTVTAAKGPEKAVQTFTVTVR